MEMKKNPGDTFSHVSFKGSIRSLEPFFMERIEGVMASHDLNVKRWEDLRAYVLRRDRFLDQLQLRYGKRVEANIVHHIFPREFFPEYTYCSWNLISLSHSTHNGLHDRSGHKLSKKGWELLKRTARAQGIELSSGLEKIVT